MPILVDQRTLIIGLKLLKALLLILPTRTFPAYSQVGPSPADEILEDNAEHSGFTLKDDFKEHGASIMTASTDRVLKLQEKNATYLHMDLVFGWDQVDVFKWYQPNRCSGRV